MQEQHLSEVGCWSAWRQKKSCAIASNPLSDPVVMDKENDVQCENGQR
jgi:hypothetical protein